MKIRINLLPYRQIRRAERQRQFGLMAAGVAILGGAIVFVGYSYIGAELDTQNSRNARLKAAITKLDADIKEISGLKDKIGELKERIQAVESLQNNRSKAVVMLDEISRLLPEAVSLKSLVQQGDVITLEGVADTNARVAILMGNLGKSTFLVNPQLLEVKSAAQNTQKISAFTLKVKLKSSTPEADVNAKKKA